MFKRFPSFHKKGVSRCNFTQLSIKYKMYLKGENKVIQLIVSVLLYFVIFFGIAFILNMLLRATWLMTFVYPVIIILIVGKPKLFDYIVTPKTAFITTYNDFLAINYVDVIILSSGLAGTIVSALVIKYLRKTGYQMF